MSVDLGTVRHIAKLAQLRLDSEQEEALVGELNAILGWVERLNEVETESVPPMTSVVQHNQPLRDDSVTESDNSEAMMANAPDSAHGFFVVPKVIE